MLVIVRLPIRTKNAIGIRVNDVVSDVTPPITADIVYVTEFSVLGFTAIIPRVVMASPTCPE